MVSVPLINRKNMGLTLSKNVILRKNVDGRNILYDKSSNMLYSITDKLFTFLYIFKDNSIDLNALLSHFESNNVSVDDIKAFLSRRDMNNLLTSSSKYQINSVSPSTNIYHYLPKITPFTEYTPEKIDFIITKKCNLSCKHCFENASPLNKIENFDMNTLKSVFCQMDNLNVKTLKITGGEPFYHPQIQSILEIVSEARFETIILTNGMLLTNSSIDLIKASNIKLGVSLDGISSKTHDFLRGKGSFKILYGKLLYIGKIGVDITLTFTVNRINESELEQLSRIGFNEIGARSIFVNRLRPIGRANNHTEMFIPDDEYILLQDRVENLASKYGRSKISLSDDSLPINIDGKEKLSGDTPLVCAAGNTLSCMDEFLNVYPCIYGQGNNNYIMGNLSKESLLDIWQSKQWMPFRGGTVLSQIKECSTCLKKNFCGIKNCRLKPVYSGLGFYDHASYCYGPYSRSFSSP